MQHKGTFGALPEKFSHRPTIASYAASDKNAATGTIRCRTGKALWKEIMGEHMVQEIQCLDPFARIKLESAKRAFLI